MKCLKDRRVINALVSPPSRGAWIEIPVVGDHRGKQALSPPSRGAWIEIMRFLPTIQPFCWCRPPRGGRGLKSANGKNGNTETNTVAALAGGVE